MNNDPNSAPEEEQKRPRTVAVFFRSLGSVLSFRVMLALATSTGVTAAVAGPMALTAMRAQDRAQEANFADGGVRSGTINTQGSDQQSQSGPNTPIDPNTPPNETTQPDGTQGSQPSTTSASSGNSKSSTTTPSGSRPQPGTIDNRNNASDRLWVSARDDGGEAIELNGAQVFGSVVLFATSNGFTRAALYIDNPTASGAPTVTRSAPPFLLGTPAFDTNSLGLGTHTLTVQLVAADGSSITQTASFEVVARS